MRQTLIVADRDRQTFWELWLVEGETPCLYRPPVLFADADRWCVEVHAGPPAPNPVTDWTDTLPCNDADRSACPMLATIAAGACCVNATDDDTPTTGDTDHD